MVKRFSVALVDRTCSLSSLQLCRRGHGVAYLEITRQHVTSLLQRICLFILESTMIILFILLFFSFTFVESGAVGECRSECVEQNLYKIVRVHLKEDLVMVGICKNTSVSTDSLSTVIPFVCHRKHGIWKLDNDDEEGIVHFNMRCPPNDPVHPTQLLRCPQPF
ncbi:hypothetical protein Angca_000394 [Angiostrongylus cantonensis]|nr:hypothetical protein Angca_000394 [Angiostrongylus cantonensis]